MVLSGTLKRANIPKLTEGNPDAQPVRTFEFEYLVRIMFFISLAINRKYESFFIKYYEENNFVGNFLRQILSPPAKYVRYLKLGSSFNTEMVIESLPPRVNLRFLSSKAFVYYFVFALVFCRILNFPILFVMFLLSLIFISYLCTKSMLASLKK